MLFFSSCFQILIKQLWKIQEKNSKGRDRSATKGSITDYMNNLDFSVPFDFCKLIFTCVLLQKSFPLLDYLQSLDSIHKIRSLSSQITSLTAQYTLPLWWKNEMRQTLELMKKTQWILNNEPLL